MFKNELFRYKGWPKSSRSANIRRKRKNETPIAVFYANGEKKMAAESETIGIIEEDDNTFIHLGPINEITMKDVNIYDYMISEYHVSSLIFDTLQESNIITPPPMYNFKLKESSSNTGFKHTEFDGDAFDASGYRFNGNNYIDLSDLTSEQIVDHLVDLGLEVGYQSFHVANYFKAG